MSGGGIGGTSGNNDLIGWCHVLPQTSFQVALAVLVPEGMTWPFPTVIYSMKGIDEIPKFEIIENPPVLPVTPGLVWWWVSAVPHIYLCSISWL